MKKFEESVGTGRRKTAVAAVRIRDGKGSIEINGKKLADYFPLKLTQDYILAPLKKVEALARYDVQVTVKGGGIQGQAGAVRHGLARSLVKDNEERRGALKEEGFLTRDAREKERKKYGHKKARKSFQFSKR